MFSRLAEWSSNWLKKADAEELKALVARVELMQGTIRPRAKLRLCWRNDSW